MRIGQQLRTRIIGLALLVAALLAISGCAGTPTPLVTEPPSAPTDTPEPTHTPEPTSTPTATATPASTSIDPTAVIAPTSGPPGTAVMVTAEGFPPNAPVDIGFGRPESEYDVIAMAQSDAQGMVSTSFEIPSFVGEDDLWVVVVVTEDREVQVISEPFQVTASAATPTPSPTAESGLFTHANIYLIAVGDAGQSGDLIGCDDSVVPVEVEIEPTIAPLTAALERLFAFDPEAEGYLDLYNALRQSDLTVDGINIVAGEATIALSGELILGGVCVNPRVEAQLERTALQYSTVDQVSITLNGEPLEDVLSLQ
ncbi:MAG: GerMN domain-containing protein [Anaerolineae bacterium]